MGYPAGGTVALTRGEAMSAAILHAHADECLLPAEPYLLVPTL